MNKPHGKRLIRRILKEKLKIRILEEIDEFEKIEINEKIAYDVENIAFGVYSPLEGFLTSEDYFSVLNELHLSDGTLWSIPIILDISEEEKQKIKEGDVIILTYKDRPLALLEVQEIYKWNKDEFCEKIFKTKDLNHPGVYETYKMKEYLIAGEIWLINEIEKEPYIVRPEETRLIFKERKWKTIVGFQTRNVPHLGHEFLIKTALNFVDGAFINPVLGKKKKGDWKDEIIKEAWEKLFELYFPKNKCFLGFVRYVMRYAGPREALHHAIMRKNFGCTHFIVGRDHAGVNNYYKPYEAQEFVKQFEDELEMEIFTFKEFFYCEKCKGIVSEDVCPHDEIFRIRFSGTLIRKIIQNREVPDEKIFRKEILETITRYKDLFY